ncbi:DUF2076 domain-containing protein [Celerinatantimonas diazotrophica]|uniref:DUF2076 family protein n=1 Tax=Celerinatantimonas diazotrophica TaxID=412034 RepID=A0A4R1J7W4_9GAMM|nr:DUF2076 domain-containing protein [Celerinatantimonas diazotrophica]TCK46441.1 hypothetical protein EV690_3721 [Celerinatantimonas diazotrophica]CAG9295182.1 hypothetical protein CEDIAZO_00294 [Celerinatantimonas diazotrophica]
MEQNTQQLIDDLFAKLKQAEQQNGQRDSDAQSLIDKHLIAQPSAPYYMAQTMIIQQATIKQLQSQVEALNARQQQTSHNKEGFLSGLFGHKQQQAPNNGGWQQQPNYNQNAQPNYNQPHYNQPSGPSGGFGGYSRTGSFLGGALQTAAGVAGGMMIGNLMMDMFSSHRPEEIVNIMNDNPTDMNNTPDMANNGFMPDNNNMPDANFDSADPNSMNNAGFDNNQFADTSNGMDDMNDPFNNGMDSNFDGGYDNGFDDDSFGGGGGFDDNSFFS